MSQEMYLKLKEKYDKKDYERKLHLIKLRFELAIMLMDKADQVAMKRHNERLQILGMPYEKNISRKTLVYTKPRKDKSTRKKKTKH